jgi:hypothetical protein
MILHSNVFFRNNLDLNPAPKLRLKPDPSLAKIHNSAYTVSIFILSQNPYQFRFLFLFFPRVAEPEPAGAETFGRSRSWSWYTEVSAPAPGSGSRAN